MKYFFLPRAISTGLNALFAGGLSSFLNDEKRESPRIENEALKMAIMWDIRNLLLCTFKNLRSFLGFFRLLSANKRQF